MKGDPSNGTTGRRSEMDAISSELSVIILLTITVVVAILVYLLALAVL